MKVNPAHVQAFVRDTIRATDIVPEPDHRDHGTRHARTAAKPDATRPRAPRPRPPRRRPPSRPQESPAWTDVRSTPVVGPVSSAAAQARISSGPRSATARNCSATAISTAACTAAGEMYGSTARAASSDRGDSYIVIIVTHPLVRWNESTPAWIPPPRIGPAPGAGADCRPCRTPSPAARPGPAASRSARPAASRSPPTAHASSFLRSRGGTDPVTCLWAFDVGTRRRSAWSPTRAPSTAGGDEDLPRRGAGPPRAGAEQARRHRRLRHRRGRRRWPRSRSSGRLLRRRSARPARPRGCSTRRARSSTRGPTPPAAASPTSAAARCTSTISTDGTTARWPSPRRHRVTYGLAEFVAAEEMDRMRGYWWSPGRRRAAGRAGRRRRRSSAGTSPTRPTPTGRPRVVAYPAAGTPNAHVALVVVGSTASGRRRRVGPGAYPYLADVVLGRATALLIVVQPRDQRRAAGPARSTRRPARPTLRARGHRRGAGSTSSPACPASTADGALVVDRRRRRPRAGCSSTASPSRPPTCRSARCSTSTATRCCSAPPTSPTVIALWTWSAADGLAAPHPASPACTAARLARRRPSSCARPVARRRRHRHDACARTAAPERTIASFAEPPGAGAERHPAHAPASGTLPHRRAAARRARGRATPLPVLMDPYGGPHAQRVRRRRAART